MDAHFCELEEYARDLKDRAGSESMHSIAVLPTRMRALHITPESRGSKWLADAFAADSATRVELESAVGVVAGSSRLREESFDAVFISHLPGELDAIELVEGLHAAGGDEPIIVLGDETEAAMAALCYEVGADAYICVRATTTRTVLWTAARAIERHRLLRENRKLHQSQQQRLQQEHDEASRLLAEQRSLIHDLEALAPGVGPCDAKLRMLEAAATPLALPPKLVDHYREILRAYVIMGSGNLAAEMSALAGLFASAGVSAQQCMLLHVQVLEELVRGLGSRSTRHVMTRADLLVLEVIIHLAEDYRRRASGTSSVAAVASLDLCAA